MMERHARKISDATSSTRAILASCVFVIAWAACGRNMNFSDTWQLVMNTASNVIALLMLFIINYTQKHDTAAMNAKLDGIIVSIQKASNELIAVEKLDAAEMHERHTAVIDGAF